ncbi:MAG: GNAT family N-acetyltransferase [Microbacterium sp.]|nr:GNAT family N-acetyltransferase [Microbacterium sp.]
MNSVPLTDGAVLRPLVLPARADVGGAADFLDYARVRNEVFFEATGRTDDSFEPEALLPLLHSDRDQTRQQWTIVEHGTVIGVATLNILADSAGRSAFLTLGLLSVAWGRGIGTAAYSQLEKHAASVGVRRLMLWAEHTDGGEPRLDAPTGFGSVPLTRGARFLVRNGYTLEQVERVSELVLDDALPEIVEARQREAAAHASDYDVVSWTLPTPAEHVAGYAHLKSRMSTDAPDADMDMPEEFWDADRIARHDERYLARGSTVLVTAARHLATGELCAYTELSAEPGIGTVTHQEDTLVLADHRGHRLGMLVKTAGLRAWHGIRPDSPRVVTYNAEENRPMLSINEAIGFTPIAYEGAWKKDLT